MRHDEIHEFIERHNIFFVQGSVNFKFGVVYAKEGQSSDDEFYSNGKLYYSNGNHYYSKDWCILVKWLICRFMDTEVDGLNLGSIGMLCP